MSTLVEALRKVSEQDEAVDERKLNSIYLHKREQTILTGLKLTYSLSSKTKVIEILLNNAQEELENADD